MSESAAQDHRRGWLDPTFVDGIGPPLEQIERDYLEWAERAPAFERVTKDVLALMAEVKRLRRERDDFEQRRMAAAVD